MRRLTLALLLAGAGVLAMGVYLSRPTGALRHGDAAARVEALETAVAEIEAGRRTTPLVGEPTAGGDATVMFIARQSGGRLPRIVSDVTGWGEHTDGTFDFTAGTMTRVGQSEWYRLDAVVVPGARIEYLIAYAPDDYRIDPHNPRQSAGPRFGGAQASEFVMPGYTPPQAFEEHPASPPGLTTEATIESRALGASSRVIVYTPAGYHAGGDYTVAVFLDLRSGQVSRVLDWLIASHTIEPVVAVFVGPQTRGDAYPEPAALRAFLTDELLAWLAPRYAVTRSADRRALIAISFGGRDALDAALSCDGALEATVTPACRHDPFRRLGLLIPGRRITRADLDSVAGRRDHLLRVAILAGRYDHANVGTARGLRQALVEAGHAVDYTEVPEGHSAVTWTHHLDAVLVSLFGQ